MNRPTVNGARAADAAGVSTDEHQVDHILSLLTLICRRTNLRIDMYQRASAKFGAGAYPRLARDFWHLMNIEDQDRQILEGVIDSLQRRDIKSE